MAIEHDLPKAIQQGCNHNAPIILLVDDQPDFVDSTSELLVAGGYRVLTASTAGAALDQLDANPEVALLLADIRMPSIDGFDLARIARCRFKSLPVVLITGLTVTAEDIIPSGLTILHKPFSFKELLTAVSASVRVR